MKQRARVSWLRGDKNTSFFQQKANRRRRKNRINKLVRPYGTICEDDKELRSMVNNFYQQLYTSEGVHDMEQVAYCSFSGRRNQRCTFPNVSYQSIRPRRISSTFFSMKLGNMWPRYYKNSAYCFEWR